MFEFLSSFLSRFSQKKALLVGVAIVSLTIILGGISAFIFSQSSSASEEGDLRIVVIFEGENRTTIVSRTTTVREALQEGGFEISPEDSIEPSLDDELTGREFIINIYRARPYVVSDGTAKIRVMTAAQTPGKIAEAAGLKLLEADIAEFIDSKNPLEDGSTVLLKITRAKQISVTIFGQKKAFRTQSPTIADFLREKKIEQTPDLWVSKSLATKITEGFSFEIAKNGKETISVEEDVDFEIEKIQDGDKEVGYSEIREPGTKGKKTVVYEVEFKNGQEVSRKKISEVEIVAPKKQVEIVGTKAQALPYSGGGSKDEWLAASGIPSQYWGYVDAIVSRESGWNPNATNPSSGACGLAQALPCSKVGGAGGYDPVTALQWMNNYVNGRYGGWEGAWAFWSANHWY